MAQKSFWEKPQHKKIKKDFGKVPLPTDPQMEEIVAPWEIKEVHSRLSSSIKFDD